MPPHTEASALLHWTVVPWGTANTAEIFNAVGMANAAQDRFHFEPCDEALPLATDKWRLRDGGLNLDEALKATSRSKMFRMLASTSKLILVTAEPYSAPGMITDGDEVNGVKRPGFFYENDVLGDEKVSLISTFLWERLPVRPDLDVLAPSGRRALAPFILLHLALIALDRLVYVASHDETLACPSDYNYNVRDIDEYFSRGKWFCEKYCNPVIRSAVVKGQLHVDQLKAVKRILNLARGKPASEGFDSCFLSYGQPDRQFARRLASDLRSRDIECWMYDIDSLPGERTWSDINNARRFADRVLIVCSKKSLTRSGVQKELELQVDENPDRLIPLSRDAEWLTELSAAGGKLGDLLPFLRQRNYADFAKLPYNKALERLVNLPYSPPRNLSTS